MNLLRGSKIKSTPGNNTIIKNISGSTISINHSDTDKIISFIEELKKSYKDTLNIFVITTSASRLKELEAFNKDIHSQYYSEELEDWKPFGSESIKDIIQEFCNETNIDANITTYIIDSVNQIDDERIWAYLKFIRTKTILILDSVSVLFNENKKIAKLFNDFAIGGCITITPNSNCKLMNDAEKCACDIFKHLDIYYEDFASQGMIHIKLSCITRKADLKNAIGSIALNHLNISRRKINGVENDILKQTNGFDELI
jgi:hypothetical protein